MIYNVDMVVEMRDDFISRQVSGGYSGRVNNTYVQLEFQSVEMVSIQYYSD